MVKILPFGKTNIAGFNRNSSFKSMGPTFHTLVYQIAYGPDTNLGSLVKVHFVVPNMLFGLCKMSSPTTVLG